jgi:hypothetical protein
MMETTTGGAYRDEHNILSFQQAIMSTNAHPQTSTQYDTQMAQLIIHHNDVWNRHVNNLLTNTPVVNPLQNSIIIMHIYIILITDNIKYYYYDGLSLVIPPKVHGLHDHLRHWYGGRGLPNSVQRETPTIIRTPTNPEAK